MSQGGINMGREMRRREEKKNKSTKNEELEFHISWISIVKVFSSIVLILLVLYFIVAVFVTKELDISKKEDASESEEVNVSHKIMAANIFRQKEETYYVYCYDFNDEDSGVGDAVNAVSDVPVYRVDTSSGYNSKYVTDESGNVNARGLDELKVSNPTLLVISGDTISGYYEGRVKIIEFLTK